MDDIQKKFECLISGKHVWQNIKVFKYFPHQMYQVSAYGSACFAPTGLPQIKAHTVCERCGAHHYINTDEYIDIIGNFKCSVQKRGINRWEINAKTLEIKTYDNKQTVIFDRDTLALIDYVDDTEKF